MIASRPKPIEKRPSPADLGEPNKSVLPKRLLLGVREALDAGGGRLRMDPAELAERLGRVIDLEVERIARVARARQRKRQLAGLFRQADLFVAPAGTKGICAPNRAIGQ